VDRHAIGLLATGGPQWIAGVVYLQNLIRALAMLETSPKVELLVGPRRQVADYADLERPPAVREYGWREGSTLARRLGATLASIALGRSLRSLESSVHGLGCVFPAMYPLGVAFPVPVMGWIPDLQHRERPDFFPRSTLAQRDRDMRRLLEEADHTLLTCQTARKHLRGWIDVADERISVVPFVTVPSDDWYAADPVAATADRGLPERFLVLPFQFWAHKNHRVAFQALRVLRDRGFSDLHLVCTGHTHDPRRPGHFRRVLSEAKELGVHDQIHVLGLLSRWEQIQILRRSTAIVQPSFFEGWSALVEDARLLGKRLYVSDIAVHREQQPFDPVFFDPADASALADRIAEDWPGLAPGPDLERERTQRATQAAAARRFAEQFLAALDRTQAAAQTRLGACSA
jgi:hypothetical protein